VGTYCYAVCGAPLRNLLADDVVRRQKLVIEWLIRDGRHVVALHPLLDGMTIVRVAVGSDDGVSHEVAAEHHVAQLVCGHTALEMAGKERWVTHQALVNGRRSAAQENHDRSGSLEQAGASPRGVQTLLRAGLQAGFEEEKGVCVHAHLKENEQRKQQICYREENCFVPFAAAQRKGRGRLCRRQQLLASDVLFLCKAQKFSGIQHTAAQCPPPLPPHPFATRAGERALKFKFTTGKD
jgi:hypothetical protein